MSGFTRARVLRANTCRAFGLTPGVKLLNYHRHLFYTFDNKEALEFSNPPTASSVSLPGELAKITK
jgi:hypothetical protein